LLASQPAVAFDVLTYHYDNQRTGWNSKETVLSVANVGGTGSFGLLNTVVLDDQVDSQPLVVTNQPVSGAMGNRTVVYVATANNTIYAIDASGGAILLQSNLGPPVPKATIGNCGNNGPDIGIAGTPTIDRKLGILYVIAYTLVAGSPSYVLHGLDLSTLTDKLTPIIVTASGVLSDGSTYSFNPSVSRQRAGLLRANGKIYAGFASFCDHFTNQSRGWVLGWNAGTLAPLPANQLDDKLATSPNAFFLTSVWMSGYGLAVSSTGNLYFSTGNSDKSGTSYDSVLNPSESVLKLAADLSKVTDFFTPSNVSSLDKSDLDLSSGGVLVLPNQPGSVPSLVVAGGKDGRLFLLNRAAGKLGGFTPGGPDKVVGTFAMGQCWCGPSYFDGVDDVGRIVTSGGKSAIIWRIQTSPTTTLVKESTTPALATGQDPGFFTSVSSNGRLAGTTIVWAVSRPTNISPANVSLYAFDASNGTQIFTSPAGTWPSGNSNANIVPVVANGEVFVASFKQLAIFGLNAPRTTSALRKLVATAPSLKAPPVGHNRLSGQIVSWTPTGMMVRSRTGKTIEVDATQAVDTSQTGDLLMNETVEVFGSYDEVGVLHAQSIMRAKSSRALWEPDQ
jgi:hypothetical protein